MLTLPMLAETVPAATEAVSGLESIKKLMDDFDPAALLPDLTNFGHTVSSLARIAVLIGPLVLLILGLAYLFLAPKEANYHFGYRAAFGMGSVEAWKYTQRMAGLIWTILGAVLTVWMFLATAGFGAKAVTDVVDSAVKCLIWEIVLTIISSLAINLLVMAHFTWKGGRRR